MRSPKDDNFQSITEYTLNKHLNNLQTLTAQTNNASPFLNPIPDEFQHAQLTAEQSYVKTSFELSKNVHLFDCHCTVQPLVTSRCEHLARSFWDPTLSEHTESRQDTH